MSPIQVTNTDPGLVSLASEVYCSFIFNEELDTPSTPNKLFVFSQSTPSDFEYFMLSGSLGVFPVDISATIPNFTTSQSSGISPIHSIPLSFIFLLNILHILP